MRRPGLLLLQPESPYVCLGFHQDARAEIDLDYVERNQIPLFHREVGGGAVYLDRGLTAEFKPVNDILVDGPKISGNGAVVELEAAREGMESDSAPLTEAIESFFERNQIEAPGLRPRQLADAFVV